MKTFVKTIVAALALSASVSAFAEVVTDSYVCGDHYVQYAVTDTRISGMSIDNVEASFVNLEHSVKGGVATHEVFGFFQKVSDNEASGYTLRLRGHKMTLIKTNFKFTDGQDRPEIKYGDVVATCHAPQ